MLLCMERRDWIILGVCLAIVLAGIWRQSGISDGYPSDPHDDGRSIYDQRY